MYKRHERYMPRYVPSANQFKAYTVSRTLPMGVNGVNSTEYVVDDLVTVHGDLVGSLLSYHSAHRDIVDTTSQQEGLYPLRAR
jgi:hypothetical protein